MKQVILIGPPGSGKSAVGSELANRLGFSFIDTDACIVKREGRAISDIFVDAGEAHFRAVECAIVQEVIKEDGSVLSLGGGAILDEGTQTRLLEARASGAEILFLTISLTTAVERIGLNKERPMLLINPRQQWSALLAARIGIYEKLATRTYSTDGETAEAVAEKIYVELAGAHARD